MKLYSLFSPRHLRILPILFFCCLMNVGLKAQVLGPLEESFNLSPWVGMPIGNNSSNPGQMHKNWTRSSSDSVNFSWKVYKDHTGFPFTIGPKGGNPNFTGNYFAIKTNPQTAGNRTASLVSPTIDISFVPDPFLEFYYHIHGPCVPNFKVELDDGSGWQQVFQSTNPIHNSQSQKYKRFKLDLSNFGNIVKVRFTATANFLCDGIIAIDDFAFRSIRCDFAENISAKLLPNYDLQLDWSSVGNANNYSIFLVPVGLQNPVQINNYIAANVTGNTAILSNLSPGQCYLAYIQSNCTGSFYSRMSSPIRICAPHCQAQAIPYSNKLSNWPASCWNSSQSNGFSKSLDIISNKGENYLKTSGNLVFPDSAYLTSPWIQMDNRKCSLKFNWTINSNPISDSLEVFARFLGSSNLLKIHSIDGARFYDPNYSTLDNNGIEEVILLDSATFAGKRVEFIIVHKLEGQFYTSLYIRNFSIEPMYTNDFELISASFQNHSACPGVNDSLLIQLWNNSDSAVDLVTKPLTISYRINGPNKLVGTAQLSHGFFGPGDTASVWLDGINRTKSGDYQFEYLALHSSPENESALNDSLFLIKNNKRVHGVLNVEPENLVMVNDNSSYVKIKAKSSQFGNGEFIITEICQFKGAADAPIGGWPSYLVADDFIEISGKANSSLDGYSLETWTVSNLKFTMPFSSLMVLSPNGTAVVGISSSTQQSFPNFYYNFFASSTLHSISSDPIGYILRNPAGEIIDAVGYSGVNQPYVFPATANVSSNLWSGAIPSASGTTGIRLEGLDENNGNNWVLASTTDQNPNSLNPGIDTNGTYFNGNFNWSHQGSHYSSAVDTIAGPFSTSGYYSYIANYTNPCGSFTDTVNVYANLPNQNCAFPTNNFISFQSCSSFTINLNSTGSNQYILEYEPFNFFPGSGTDTVFQGNSIRLTGLTSNTDYTIWLRKVCGNDSSSWAGPFIYSTIGGVMPFPRFFFSKKVIGNQIQLIVDASNSANTDEYFWEFGNNGLTGYGAIDTILLSTNEILKVKLIAKNNCGQNSLTYSSLINISLDEVIASNLQFDIYPNPTTGLINLDINSKTDGELKASIVDINGKVLLSENLFLAKGSNSYSMNLNGYPKGLYFLVLQSESGVWKRKVLVR